MAIRSLSPFRLPIFLDLFRARMRYAMTCCQLIGTTVRYLELPSIALG